ncbi:hypothetical protein HYPBUDRAFT_151931 [Hyphopichia burtonii NRRL Y-1933]|uniref:Sulfhydryl oxidase n=1 Tax=Hyphopichia burtonii NRRL Y-1933 TaxID=984485 RepID=A0A1E4RMJ9_9ASCO|nr:hypothetical protein HYPBUDRAFT_151931 [Hyphopichia burtonii NRRL Y-1933]ODV68479.1 hypothetical protein HYPBUDRAFT_151931 [Hyphopichia burtonii NRRL Y-1933]
MVTTFLLLVVISIIYYMSSSSSTSSLGNISPITRNSIQNENLNLVNQQQKSEKIIEQEETAEDPEVIKRPTKQKEEPAKEQVPVKEAQPLEDEGAAIQITETPFMPKMANETLKAQLGNAAWKLFHTILARYPDKPSQQEQSTLNTYIQLFGQVYPCGDCARHFQHLLKKFPPQVGSRKTAALWGCDIHNKVNEKLHKSQYDCTTILEDYDCGCGGDEQEKDFTLGNESIDHVRNIKVDEKEDKLQLGG